MRRLGQALREIDRRYREGFGSIEPKRFNALAFFKLKWQDAHADQVRAMDTLEALSKGRTYAL